MLPDREHLLTLNIYVRQIFNVLNKLLNYDATQDTSKVVWLHCNAFLYWYYIEVLWERDSECLKEPGQKHLRLHLQCA